MKHTHQQIVVDKSKKAGFTILYAILIAGLLLAVGVSIFNISIREFNLSLYANQSQEAMFAADAGYECAFFWNDSRFIDSAGNLYRGFATSTESAVMVKPIMKCGTRFSAFNPVAGGGDLDMRDPYISAVDATSAVSNFILYLDGTESDPNFTGKCAVVSVTNSLVSGAAVTQIDSRGYNTCDGSNPRIVERGITLYY
jgi:hypothetical protein